MAGHVDVRIFPAILTIDVHPSDLLLSVKQFHARRFMHEIDHWPRMLGEDREQGVVPNTCPRQKLARFEEMLTNRRMPEIEIMAAMGYAIG